MIVASIVSVLRMARAGAMHVGNHPVEFLPLFRRQYVLQTHGCIGDVHHLRRMGRSKIGSAARDAGGIGRLVDALAVMARIADRAFDRIHVCLPGFLLR